MGVSENSGTPKSSNLIGFSIINHPFWGTTIFGNPRIGMFVGCQSQLVFLMLFWMLKCSPFASCDGSLATETSPETLK